MAVGGENTIRWKLQCESFELRDPSSNRLCPGSQEWWERRSARLGFVPSLVRLRRAELLAKEKLDGKGHADLRTLPE